MAGEHPRERVAGEPAHGIELLGPRVPAVIAVGGERPGAGVPSQVVAREQEVAGVEQDHVAAGMAGRGYGEEPVFPNDGVETAQDVFGGGLRGTLQAMDDAGSAETGRLFFGIGHVVAASEEDVAEAAAVREATRQRFYKTRGIDEPVSARMLDEVAVAAVGFGRVEAAVIDVVVELQREVSARRLCRFFPWRRWKRWGRRARRASGTLTAGPTAPLRRRPARRRTIAASAPALSKSAWRARFRAQCCRPWRERRSSRWLWKAATSG